MKPLQKSEKMIKILFLCSVISLLFIKIPMIYAGGISPVRLTFDQAPNEEKCQIVTVSSESSLITISDSWYKYKNDDEGDLSLYTEDKSIHGIHMRYDNELSSDERDVEVCLSGENYGSYRGVLYLQEAKKGTTVLQMAVRLTVMIHDSAHPISPSGSYSSSSGGSSGTSTSSGGGSGSVLATNTTLEKKVEEVIAPGPVAEKKETEENNPAQVENSLSSWITGNVIGIGTQRSFYAGIFIALIVIVSLIVYKKREKDEFYVH